jgi:hypothetical protein
MTNIIIISESNDTSAKKVMDWLDFYETKVERKNVDTDFSEINIQINNKSSTASLSNQIIWNRRGYLPLIPTNLKQTYWIDYLKKEQQIVLFSLEHFNKQNYIGSYQQELQNNKLLNLQEAANVGLNIPNTLVTNNKKDLFAFVKKDKKYITKSLNFAPNLETATHYYSGNGTTLLDLENINDYFAPSLIQEYIEKEIEIRTFFIEDNFYPMAIFSQNDTQTKIDFRNYIREKPNRNVPFILEQDLLNKIKQFVLNIKSNTGSIDLILTPEGKYIFLEINPMGQYDWLSIDCNYHIDKKIAELLIEKSNNV